MKKVTIYFYGIEFDCKIELRQADNIDNGFEILSAIPLNHTVYQDFQHVLDQDKLIKLIYEQLKSSL